MAKRLVSISPFQAACIAVYVNDQKRMPNNPHATMNQLDDRDAVVWTDRTGKIQTAAPGPALLNRELHGAKLARQGHKYPHRRNYEGYYWFAETRRHVWYESMTEYTSLMLLDHRGGIREIVSQPMYLIFKDNTRHYPDFFAVHTDDSQILYDVKPREHLTVNVLEQFEKTRILCEQVGWGYVVLNGLNRVERHNLEWLAAYRHGRHRPIEEQRAWVLGQLDGPLTLGELFQRLDAALPARIVHLVYSLMWACEIGFDLSRPLQLTTPVWRLER